MSLSIDYIRKEFQQIAQDAKSKNLQVELLIDSGESLVLGAQKARLEKFDQKTFQTAGFRVLLNGLQGYASTENLSSESLERTYKAALQNVQDLERSQKNESFKKGESSEGAIKWKMTDGSESYRQNLDLDFGEQGTIQQKIQIALDLEKNALAGDPRVTTVPYNSTSESVAFRTILNSEGLDCSYQERHFMSYCYPSAKQGEQTKMLGEAAISRRLKDMDPKKIAEVAVKRTVELLGAEKLATGNYSLVLDREVAQEFFGMLKSAFSAKGVFEKRSPFAGRLGQKVSVDFLTIYDDPLDLRGGGVRPFDSEGTPSKKIPLIEKGILKNFLTNREYAAKMNLPLTAHAARSATSEMSIGGTTFIFPMGTKSQADLLSKYPRMIHVVELSAFHSGFNSTTGDFSLPGQGFLFENGQKTKAVDQFVMSGNIFNLLNEIEEFSNENGSQGSGVICSDVLIKSLSFA